MFLLRAFIAFEFWQAGVEKFNGENWFAQMPDDFFPFPFNILPATLSWNLAMWSELLGSIALVIGLGTRYAAISLLILDLVAWASVHAANGYNVCDNGYKLPLIYLLMLLPIIFSGAGKFSLDHLIKNRFS